jgi:hypothetical protein
MNCLKEVKIKDKIEENTTLIRNFTYIDNIKKNYMSWIIIFTCIFMISYSKLLLGFFTFFLLMFIAYFFHYSSHKHKNILTKIHEYHHDNNNYFSYISQIILELSIGLLFLPFIYLNWIWFDPWIVVLFTLFYSTLHNINYGVLHVNNVHFKHHKDVYTNIGPDICDIIFSTKNESDDDIENTNHYIPNIIIITILIMFLKYMCKNDKIQQNLLFFITIIAVIFCISIIISLLILHNYTSCEQIEKPIEETNEKPIEETNEK